ncbi:hypothetical protein [Streptomyces sp. NPDC048295]|uniref:hypothetical protein n=1 Tax=Streptomyces sp. NPDC048295 TaxID=3154617 RepID=UPI00344839F2
MLDGIDVIAGTLSTIVFIASTLPMVAKAVRTRDLSSYSGGNLVLSNTGNLLYGVYVASLPVGPAWALYAFNLAVSATMLVLWLSYRARRGRAVRPAEFVLADLTPVLSEGSSR